LDLRWGGSSSGSDVLYFDETLNANALCDSMSVPARKSFNEMGVVTDDDEG
jgi:hypothetical protein